jgi:hypothetical protein
MVLGVILTATSFLFGDIFSSAIGPGTVMLMVGAFLFFMGYVLLSRPDVKK